MIKLKTEVNKTQLMRELYEEANKSYEQTWWEEIQIQAYMNGAHDLFKKLRLSDGIVSDVIEMPIEIGKCEK